MCDSANYYFGSKVQGGLFWFKSTWKECFQSKGSEVETGFCLGFVVDLGFRGTPSEMIGNGRIILFYCKTWNQKVELGTPTLFEEKETLEVSKKNNEIYLPIRFPLPLPLTFEQKCT